jgi:hypothetical protein
MKKINWQDPTAAKPETSKKEWGNLLVHLGKIFVSIVFLVASIYFMLWPQFRVNYIFKPVTCVVLQSKIQPTSDKEGAGFQPRFLVLYRVDDKTHISWVYDILNISMTNPDIRKQAVRQYSEGNLYTCWYDPANPQIAVLKRSWNKMAVLFCVLAGFVALITIISFVRWLRRGKE